MLSSKPVFIETSDPQQTSDALAYYKRACDAGRGAVFLTTPRSKAVAAADFDRHYGRATLLLGVPYAHVGSCALQARLDYLRDAADVDTATYLTFDAMRLAVGRAARSVRDHADYSVLVLADKRFGRPDKQKLTPAWLRELMSDSVLNMSTDDAVSRARLFLRDKAQAQAAPRALSLEELRKHPGYVEEPVGKRQRVG